MSYSKTQGSASLQFLDLESSSLSLNQFDDDDDDDDDDEGGGERGRVKQFYRPSSWTVLARQ